MVEGIPEETLEMYVDCRKGEVGGQQGNIVQLAAETMW